MATSAWGHLIDDRQFKFNIVRHICLLAWGEEVGSFWGSVDSSLPVEDQFIVDKQAPNPYVLSMNHDYFG